MCSRAISAVERSKEPLAAGGEVVVPVTRLTVDDRSQHLEGEPYFGARSSVSTLRNLGKHLELLPGDGDLADVLPHEPAARPMGTANLEVFWSVRTSRAVAVSQRDAAVAFDTHHLADHPSSALESLESNQLAGPQADGGERTVVRHTPVMRRLSLRIPPSQRPWSAPRNAM